MFSSVSAVTVVVCKVASVALGVSSAQPRCSLGIAFSAASPVAVRARLVSFRSEFMPREGACGTSTVRSRTAMSPANKSMASTRSAVTNLQLSSVFKPRRALTAVRDRCSCSPTVLTGPVSPSGGGGQAGEGWAWKVNKNDDEDRYPEHQQTCH